MLDAIVMHGLRNDLNAGWKGRNNDVEEEPQCATRELTLVLEKQGSPLRRTDGGRRQYQRDGRSSDQLVRHTYPINSDALPLT